MYYYFLLLSLYEFVPLLFGTLGAACYLVRRSAPAPAEAEAAPHAPGAQPLFVPLLIFCALHSLFLCAWAGERMPWMVVHQALPILLLAGKFLGDLLGHRDWREIWQRGGALLAVLLPLTLFGFYNLARLQPPNNVLATLPPACLL